MKATIPTIVFICVLCVFFACTSQKYTFKNLPGTHIKFGNGGGFSGARTTYTLLQNGQLFVSNSLTKETKELKPLSKKKASDFFMDATRERLMDISFRHAGNTYFFVETTENSKTNTIVWGNPDHIVPQNISSLYYKLVEAIK